MAGDPPKRPRSLAEMVVRGVVSGALLAVTLHAAYVLGGGNFRTVLPGQVFRCAQPTSAALERSIVRHGIRTVVNLRGCCPTAPWYLEEARVTAKHGVALEDVALSATRLPSSVGVRQLLEVIDRAEYPILFHCHQGADRTGLASVMTLLLRTDATLPQALPQLGLGGGHLPVGKTANIDRFFVLYQDWLDERGSTHSSETFRTWVRDHYQGDEGSASITLVQAESGVVRVRAGERPVLTARCRNTSLRAWTFTPGSNAGVHLWWSVLDRDEHILRMERAGLFHAVVEPGGSIDILIPLPGLPPGRYELRLDLANEQHGFFLQMGNDLFTVELEVS